ncbi:MAG: hypothetical protein K8I03_15165 [Ignavibacteria bacterium]|nr:hypothetical protein [Ignavibacteria bacterium]
MPGFSSSYSPLFSALILIVSILVSYFFYRNSPLTGGKKYFLIILKSLAIFLLLFLLIEPVISLVSGVSNEKLDVILIDDTRSNNINSKSDMIKSIISDNNLSGSNYKLFTFTNSVRPFIAPDSLKTDGFETDLSASLRSIKETFPDRTFNSVTIISDGIFNSGSSPLYEAKTFQAPFITLAIGDTVQQNDVSVRNIIHSDNAFTNISTKIKVSFDVFGYGSVPVSMNLLKEGTVVSSKQISVSPGSSNYEAEFDITESTPGKIHYRVQSEPLSGELTNKNNYSDFFITYTDNKVNLLVLSGGPGYDNEFTGSVIKRMGNYNITYRTSKSGTDFYEGGLDYKAFPELSAIFLLSYPAAQTSGEILGEISANAKLFSIPIIFFAGRNSDYQKLNAFDELIPFSLSRPGAGEVQFQLQPVGSADNPISKVAGLGSTAQIFRNVAGILPKPGSVTLATDKGSGEPVMITRTSGNFKSTAFLGYGLWRWRLNSSSDAIKTMESLLTEVINMTLQKEKKTKFKVYPQKGVFDYSEKVKIIAEVFDDNFAPTRNAKVTGSILNKDGSKSVILNFVPDENKYSAYVDPLPYNEYKIEAEAELGGTFYAKDNSRFIVDTVNTEFLETKTNSEQLRLLANNTGGRYLESNDFGNLNIVISETARIENSTTQTKRENRFNLWENKYILGLIILLFAAEWVLRKRSNIL